MSEIGRSETTDPSSPGPHVERRLAAIFATDVAGYSRLMAGNEPGTLATLKAHRAVIDQAIATHHGRIVNTAGDSVLAEFRSPIETVECAVEIQKELARRNGALPEHRRMEFRIGINLGDVMVDGVQIYGDSVNIAARLEGLADAGAICVSGSVVDQVRGKVPYWFENMGLQRVKNIPERVRTYGLDFTEGSGAQALARRRRRYVAAAAAGLAALVLGGGFAGLSVFGWFTRPTVSTPPQDLQFLRDCGDCPEMVMVSPGMFLMGSSKDAPGHQAREGPQRRVTVSKRFAIGRYEITFAQWDACVEAGGCSHKPIDRGWGRGNRPVIYVSWADAQEYAAWLSARTGQRYRLPSEAEWEYVARAGAAGDYWWGDKLIKDAAVCSNCVDNGDVTFPVGSFPPNPFGVYDVHGNVREWTQDCWNGTYAGAPTDSIAWLTGECDKRVVRGGAWGLRAEEMRLAFREGAQLPLRSGKGGFRLVRELE